MAFVNEYIPEADVEKYGLAEIDNSNFGGTRTKSRDWTIDRERNIYLRRVGGQDRENLADNTDSWNFFWKGDLLWFRRKGFPSEKKPDGLRHAFSYIRDLTIPTHLESQRQEIYQDLRDAFRTYGGGGVFSTSTDYVHNLEFTA